MTTYDMLTSCMVPRSACVVDRWSRVGLAIATAAAAAMASVAPATQTAT